MTFTRSSRIATGTLAAIAAMLLFHTPVGQAAEQRPLRVNFSKCFVEDGGPFGGHYEGVVDGDFGVGTVLFTFASVVPGDVIWKFSGVYTITTPSGVISAFAAGIDSLESGSGHDVLNGVVIAGARLGAQVHVDAEDTNGGACAEGTITVRPIK